MIGRGNRSFGRCTGKVFVVDDIIDTPESLKTELERQSDVYGSAEAPKILSKAV